MLARLEGEQKDYPRSVRIVVVLRAVAAEPQIMRLDLRLVKLSVYNNDLTRELYRFGAGRDQGILSAGNGVAALLKPAARHPALVHSDARGLAALRCFGSKHGV